MNKKIMVGGAWPYANGSLHIGHMAALVPGDVIARYHRAQGDEVLYVSGSDCHGTPISIRAKKENVSPMEIANHYHKEFKECFERLDFTYDKYECTMDSYHEKFVKDFFEVLIDNGSFFEKEVKQVYCEHCNKFLPDRYVVGTCPICGSEARGDQCDNCGSLLEPEKLKDFKCAICGNTPVLRPSKQLYLDMHNHLSELEKFVNDHENWRFNAKNESKKYIQTGIQDRAATRDLDWGIDVPKDGYEDKKIYVWFDAVLGYLSMVKKVCDESGIEFKDFWNDSKHYYIHGKDNIPFHTIILPSLLLSYGDLHLPDMIVSSEYMTLEGKKISTSKNWAIWIPYLLDNYNSDLIRLYFTAYGPEAKDSDFSWNNFISFHNSQLVGAYGNFVNRTLAFINKYNSHIVYKGELEDIVKEKIQYTYDEVAKNIEHANFRTAIENIFQLVDFANKYYDEKKPWVSRNEDIDDCGNTMYNCVQLVANLAVIFNPFIPESSETVQNWFKINNKWVIKIVPEGFELPDIKILYERIDKKKIDEEIEALNRNSVL